MADLFSDAALKKELDKLPQLPPEEGGVGVVLERGDVGVTGSFNKQIGKGWSVMGEGSWMRQTGYRVAGWFGWKGQSK